MKEAWADLAQKMDELEKKTKALAEEKTKAVETARLLEEVAKEKLELNKQRFEDAEQAKLVLNNLQMTYQHQVIRYESQAAIVAAIIVRPKSEKQEAEECAKLGVDRIRHKMSTWRDRTQTSIKECSEKVWKEWSHQAVELQTFRADDENRRKAGDKFYKMDEESIVTIRE